MKKAVCFSLCSFLLLINQGITHADDGRAWPTLNTTSATAPPEPQSRTQGFWCGFATGINVTILVGVLLYTMIGRKDNRH
jgi:hypothetical protein